MMADNIYKKINAIRTTIHANIANGEIKKTGRNPYHKSKFFSLDDIVGPIQREMSKHNLYHEVNLTDRAMMTVLNLDNTDEIVEVSFPIPAFDTMQDVGKAITYSRRYLYYMLFNISEVDDDYSDEIVKAESDGPTEEKVTNVDEPPRFLKHICKKAPKSSVKLTDDRAKVVVNAAYAEGKISDDEKQHCLTYIADNGVGALI